MRSTLSQDDLASQGAMPFHSRLAALLLLIVLSLTSTAPGRAQGDPGQASATLPPHPPIQAHRVAGEIKVDGVLDENAWSLRPNNGLVQNEPENGVEPRQLTDWWFAYDDKAIYAAFRFHDSAPDSIETEIARRDVHLNTDRVELELDTYNDGRTGYLFRVTSGGAIADATLYNDGWGDHSWDGVWQSAARVDGQGWCAEIRIPLSQLRFPDAAQQTWGINVSRYTKRTQGRDDLFHRPRNEAGYISRFPDLVGMDGLQGGSSREALLYGAARGEFLPVDPQDPFRSESDYSGSFGGDLRVGLSNTLNLNATFNPDFGQVEVDPAVVNLSDFETFFPEKRPFFVQDSNLFRFGREGTSSNWNFNWMDPMPFYSRRVGRQPQIYPEEDFDYLERPDATTILGAAKLTGTFGSTSGGLMTAMTGREYNQTSLDGVVDSELAEPLTNYSVLRTSRNFEGERALGFMLTSTLRDLSTINARDNLTDAAFSAGVDGWTYLDADGRWALKGYATGSFIHGSESAIAQQQLSSRRYYQRPDATHLNYDDTLTSLSGWAARTMLNKQKGAYRLNAAFGAISPGYEINDLGFQNRADNINGSLVVGRRWTEPKGIFRGAGMDLGSYSTWDFGGHRNGGGAGLFYWAEFSNYWSINGNFFYNPRNENTRATRGGPILRNPDNREFFFSIQGDRRMKVRPSLWVGAGRSSEGGSNAWGSVEFTFRPSSALSFSIEPGFSYADDTYQYVNTVSDELAPTYGHRYIFGDLDYREVNLGMRLDWAFTPRLTIQAFAQPLIAVGDYQTIKEFSEPGGYEFKVYGEDGGSTLEYDETSNEYIIDPGDGGDVFRQWNPNFNFKSLRLNMVLRWEYMPGSTFYLVWTRDKADFADPGGFDMGRDLSTLLQAQGQDIVMVKLTRYFNF